MGPLTLAAAWGGKYLFDSVAGWLGGGTAAGPDFRTRMLQLADAAGAPTAELTDRTWKTLLETEDGDRPVYVHAGGAVYTHSVITFRRRRAPDALRDRINRDPAAACECRVMEVDGLYVLWYLRKVPLASLTPESLARHCAELAGIADGVDASIREHAGG